MSEELAAYKTPESDVEPGVEAPGDKERDAAAARKRLIPIWIKCFGWLFIIGGATTPILFIFSVSTGTEMAFSMFGLQYTGSEITVTSISLVSAFMALGVSAYGLLFGKWWGLDACLITGYLGLATVFGVSAYHFLQGRVELRLEPIIQIPYLYKLHAVRRKWRQ